MISILIPTYNYNVLPLAKNLVNRAKKQGLIFELICMDDGSNSVENKSNNDINSLPNSKFIERKTNLGRTATRQALAKEAKYDWLLFLDADITPKNDAFISQYTAFVSEPYDAIFGGFAYNPEKGMNFGISFRYQNSMNINTSQCNSMHFNKIQGGAQCNSKQLNENQRNPMIITG